MTFSFVIVNYNTRELLKDCIENLLKVRETYKGTEIIVVDNLSFDGTDQMIQYEYKDKVIFIKNTANNLPMGHNLGFGASHGDFVVHLGSDAYPTADQLQILVEFMNKTPDAGICTGKIVTKDGNLDMDAHRGLVTPWTALSHWSGLDKIFAKNPLFDRYFLGYKDMTVPHEIDVCISHFMMIRREAYEKVGKWDTTFFMYGEDLDFCYRMQKAGYKIYYVPQAVITHLKGATVGRKSTDNIDNASRRDYNHMKRVRKETVRAMRIFYTKHLAPTYPFYVNWAVYSGMSLLKIFRSVKFFILGSGY